MAELVNLEKLSIEVRALVEPYCRRLLELHRDKTRALILYGSAVGKDFVKKRSNINLLLVLESVTLDDLKKSLKLVSSGRNKNIVAPLFLSIEHIQTSTDVYPIEFLDIKENHLLLAGEDPFSDLEIDLRNLRLQCEQELKGKMIRLREAYLEIGLRGKGIEELLISSLTSFVPVLRNLLRLKGVKPQTGKEETIRAVATEFGLDEGVFLSILRDKRGDEKIGRQDAQVVLGHYMGELAKLVRQVDEI